MTQSVHSHTGPAALIKLAQDVLNTEIAGLAAVRDRLSAQTPEKAPLVLALGLLAACTGRVVVTGIGKSGLVGRKLAATFSSTGTPAFFLHPVEGAHGDLGSLRKDDVIHCHFQFRRNGGAERHPARAEIARHQPDRHDGEGGLHPWAPCRRDAAFGRPPRSLPARARPYSLDHCCPRPRRCAGRLPDAAKIIYGKDFLRYHPGGSLGQRLKLNVKEVMRTEGLPQLSETSLLSEALRQLDQGKLGAVLLLDGERRISGILTDGDVRRAVCRGTLDPQAPVSTVMTPSPRCGTLGDTVATLLELMESKAITVLPIADEERRLLGMVHMHDLLGQGSIAFSQH